MNARERGCRPDDARRALAAGVHVLSVPGDDPGADHPASGLKYFGVVVGRRGTAKEWKGGEIPLIQFPVFSPLRAFAIIPV